MASLATVCRATARASSSRAIAARRTLTSSTPCLAAQNFTMPALSPTMTEGNIAGWNVKEGDSFSAGDVLLEIETDKATMDVEAQDDGIMFKIIAQSGSKSVQVGSRIAVVAEAGDNIAALEVPAEQTSSSTSTSSTATAAAKTEQTTTAPSTSKPVASGENISHKYPLLPSVGHLVKEKGLTEDDLSKIKGTGPNGRLLKGDVLAYLGAVKASTPATISSRFEKLSHLDLSNIKVAAKKATAPSPSQKDTVAAPPVIENLEIKVPISLSAVVQVQDKIQKTLGVFLPLSTFVNRAVDVANDNLPPVNRPPTTSELFDQVLGLDKIKPAKKSTGGYLPLIASVGPSPSVISPRLKKTDIIDVLAGVPTSSSTVRIPTVPGLSSDRNIFSLVVPKSEEERAQVFLERCKVILEDEPGCLVL